MKDKELRSWEERFKEKFKDLEPAQFLNLFIFIKQEKESARQSFAEEVIKIVYKELSKVGIPPPMGAPAILLNKDEFIEIIKSKV